MKEKNKLIYQILHVHSIRIDLTITILKHQILKFRNTKIVSNSSSLFFYSLDCLNSNLNYLKHSRYVRTFTDKRYSSTEWLWKTPHTKRQTYNAIHTLTNTLNRNHLIYYRLCSNVCAHSPQTWSYYKFYYWNHHGTRRRTLLCVFLLIGSKIGFFSPPSIQSVFTVYVRDFLWWNWPLHSIPHILIRTSSVSNTKLIFIQKYLSQ